MTERQAFEEALKENPYDVTTRKVFADWLCLTELVTMTERQIFEKTLREDPYDRATRLIFADWLYDHDEPELAEFHRNWSKETYEEAKAWMTRYAETVDEDGDVERTYRELLEAGEKYRADPNYRAYIDHTGMTAQEEFFHTPIKDKYWESWGILMDCPNAENDNFNFFRCGC